MKLWAALGLCVLLCGGAVFTSSIYAQEPESTNDLSETSERHDLLRSNLQLQDQLHDALKAIERARLDAETAAQKNAELFSERLESVERNLAIQREQDLQAMMAMRQSNRLALIAAAIVACLGMISLFLTAYFQIRAMNRMAALGALVSSATQMDHSRMLHETSVPAALPATPTDQATSRFLSAIEHLERRINELDTLNSAAAEGARLAGARPQVEWKPPGRMPPSPEAVAQIRALLNEGQTFLNGGDPEKALIWFDKALGIDPQNAEAHVKKGTALEAQRKLHEAIESYDRAIGSDPSLTVAYLYKGGALGRLQRFSEAMACYEQALRNHPKKAA